MGVDLLQKLRIAEVSGVADPANDLPGFAVMKASGDYGPAREEFAQLLSDIRERADLTDEQKLEITKAAINVLPTQVTMPVLKTAAEAQMIREAYPALKQRHDAHDDRGRFARKPDDGVAAKARSLPWAHRGANLIP